MTTSMQTQPLEELAKDPLLAVAAVLLIVVSIGWIVVSRVVSRNLRKRAAQAQKKKGPPRPPKDIWSGPP